MLQLLDSFQYNERPLDDFWAINWEHPLSRGLVALYLFNSRGSHVTNLVNGTRTDLGAGTFSWVTDENGVGYRPNVDVETAFPIYNRQAADTSKLTVAARFRVKTHVTEQNQCLFEDGTNGRGISITVSATGAIQGAVSTNNGTGTPAATGVLADRIVTASVSNASSGSLSGDLYVNGAYIGQGSNSGTAAGTVTRLRVGDSSGYNNEAKGNLFWAAAWADRILTGGEHAQLYSDFPALLVPKRGFWYGEGAASSAPYTLTADQASFTLTGVATGVKAGRKFAAAVSAYTLTGNATALRAARKLTAAQATYTLSGVNVTLTYSGAVGSTYTLTADPSAYVLTGIATGLKAARKFAAAQATFTLSGQATTLRAGRKLTAAARSYALTGVAANFLRAYALRTETAAYTIVGTDVTLTYSGQLFWTPVTPAVGSWAQTSPQASPWTPVPPQGPAWSPTPTDDTSWANTPPSGGTWTKH